MREYEITTPLQKILSKLFKKDKVTYEAIMSKITEIINASNFEVQHYKNLQHNLSYSKRVHIMKSFVLIFSFDSRKNKIIFEDYDHHDKIYGK